MKGEKNGFFFCLVTTFKSNTGAGAFLHHCKLTIVFILYTWFIFILMGLNKI